MTSPTPPHWPRPIGRSMSFRSSARCRRAAPARRLEPVAQDRAPVRGARGLDLVVGALRRNPPGAALRVAGAERDLGHAPEGLARAPRLARRDVEDDVPGAAAGRHGRRDACRPAQPVAPRGVLALPLCRGAPGHPRRRDLAAPPDLPPAGSCRAGLRVDRGVLPHPVQHHPRTQSVDRNLLELFDLYGATRPKGMPAFRVASCRG